MKKFTIAPKARADLKVISRYTDQKWGRQQRFKYIGQLKDRFSYLANNSQMGRKREEIIGSPYSYHEGSSIVPLPKASRS